MNRNRRYVYICIKELVKSLLSICANFWMRRSCFVDFKEFASSLLLNIICEEMYCSQDTNLVVKGTLL